MAAPKNPTQVKKDAALVKQAKEVRKVFVAADKSALELKTGKDNLSEALKKGIIEGMEADGGKGEIIGTVCIDVAKDGAEKEDKVEVQFKVPAARLTDEEIEIADAALTPATKDAVFEEQDHISKVTDFGKVLGHLEDMDPAVQAKAYKISGGKITITLEGANIPGTETEKVTVPRDGFFGRAKEAIDDSAEPETDTLGIAELVRERMAPTVKLNVAKAKEA